MTLALTSEFVALLKKDFRKSTALVFDATEVAGSESMHLLRHRCCGRHQQGHGALEQANSTCPERLSLIEMCCRVVQFVP